MSRPVIAQPLVVLSQFQNWNWCIWYVYTPRDLFPPIIAHKS